MINPRRRGSERDQEIIKLIEDLKVLDTNQIAALLFRFPSGIRKAQERLQKLVKAKRIKKPLRVSIDRPNIYCAERSGRMEHTLSANWVYIYLTLFHDLRVWDPEPVFGDLRADAAARAAGGWIFVEMDLAESRNNWDKVVKYNKLYEQEGRKGSEMMRRLGDPDRFPRILVVTTDSKRAERIRGRIERENKYSLRWEVKLLDQIIKEATTL